MSIIFDLIFLCSLIAVNPATSATAERSFSMARRIKSWERSSMTQRRFNSLAILNSYKELVDDLNLLEVGNEFVAKHDSRKLVFETFVEFDLK